MFLLSLRKAKSTLLALVFCFIANAFLPYSSQAAVLPYMPGPGQMILPDNAPYSLPYIVGMRFNSGDIFNFTFILNRGNLPVDEKVLRAEIDKVGKYFLAALAIPEQDLWVNLSPYEQDRIITTELGRTELGKDLLGEDYVLKQLAASLTYPESESGKKYWQSINSVGANGCSSVNSFSKVWIIPGTIKMTEARDRVVINDAALKVLTEEDYLAAQKNGVGTDNHSPVTQDAMNRVSTSSDSTTAMREVIVPLIEKEVNTGKHFAQLRQLYSAIIMAGWFKRKLKDTVLNQVYFNQKKIKGADINDPALKEKVYNEYVKAFKQGVYNVIKKESVGTNNHSLVQKITRRQYFSGGARLTAAIQTEGDVAQGTASQVNAAAGQLGNVEATVRLTSADQSASTVGEANDSALAGLVRDFLQGSDMRESFGRYMQGLISTRIISSALSGRPISRQSPHFTRIAALTVLSAMEGMIPIFAGESVSSNNLAWHALDRVIENPSARGAPAQEQLLAAIQYAHEHIGQGKKIRGTADKSKGEEELTQEEIIHKILYVMRQGGAAKTTAIMLAAAGVVGEKGSRAKNTGAVTSTGASRMVTMNHGIDCVVFGVGQSRTVRDILGGYGEWRGIIAPIRAAAIMVLAKMEQELKYPIMSGNHRDSWIALSQSRAVLDGHERGTAAQEELLNAVEYAYRVMGRGKYMKEGADARADANTLTLPEEEEKMAYVEDHGGATREATAVLFNAHVLCKESPSQEESALMCGWGELRDRLTKKRDAAVDTIIRIVSNTRDESLRYGKSSDDRLRYFAAYNLLDVWLMKSLERFPGGKLTPDSAEAMPVDTRIKTFVAMLPKEELLAMADSAFEKASLKNRLTAILQKIPSDEEFARVWQARETPVGTIREIIEILLCGRIIHKDELPGLVTDHGAIIDQKGYVRKLKSIVRKEGARVFDYDKAREIAEGHLVEVSGDGSGSEIPGAVVGEKEADGGFNFVKTNAGSKVAVIGGGLKLSAKKSADSLIKNDITGLKLTITFLRY